MHNQENAKLENARPCHILHAVMYYFIQHKVVPNSAH